MFFPVDRAYDKTRPKQRIHLTYIFGNKICKVKKSRITLLDMSVKATVLQIIKPLTCFHSPTLKTRPT